MTYQIETITTNYQLYDAQGIWLEGNRIVTSESTELPDTYDADDDYEGAGPVAWAVELISHTDAYEPSTYPVRDETGPQAWLSGTYADPYGRGYTDTTIRLTGDWTDTERSEVFRAVYRRVHPSG